MDLVNSLLRPSEPDYSDVLRRLGLSYVVARGRVEEERAHARALWPELERQTPEIRLYMVKNLKEFHAWGIYEIVLEKVKILSRNDPLQAVDLAHLAVTMAELMDVDFYGPERKCDFLANARTALGNAKRITGDLRGAEAELQEATTLLQGGTGDPYDKANLISIYSSLKADLGYLEDATGILFPAIGLARRVGDKHLEGRLIVKQSSHIGYVDPVMGIKFAQKGLKLLDLGSDAHMELVARHLLALWTNEAGYPSEASRILDTYRHLYAKFGDVFWTGRLLHLEAYIARNECNFRRSEIFFRQLVALYAEHNFEFDLALASLDLAEVQVSQGKMEESSEILRALLPILQNWNLNGDILRSWVLLQEGVEHRVVQEEAFRNLAMTLRRKWYRKEE